MIIVNFKCYPESTGLNAIKLAKACESVAKSTGKTIIIAPSVTDLIVSKIVSIQVYSQHVDPIEEGPHTGRISTAQLRNAGIKGTLINHSEHPLPLESIKKCVELAQKHKITSIVCASSLTMIKKIIAVSTPDYIAYEPSELISGNISVTTAQPDIIKQAAATIKSPTKLLCGAGIKTKEDIKTALQLGAVGVLVSSSIVKASNPENALKELATAF